MLVPENRIDTFKNLALSFVTVAGAECGGNLGREVGCWQLDRYSSNQFDKERDNKCYNSSSLQAFFCLSPVNLNAPFCQDISTVSQKE
ncbi:MAG: hypothetical protein ACKPAE_17905, partial [Microcystis panniformis]